MNSHAELTCIMSLHGALFPGRILLHDLADVSEVSLSSVSGAKGRRSPRRKSGGRFAFGKEGFSLRGGVGAHFLSGPAFSPR